MFCTKTEGKITSHTLVQVFKTVLHLIGVNNPKIDHGINRNTKVILFTSAAHQPSMSWSNDNAKSQEGEFDKESDYKQNKDDEGRCQKAYFGQDWLDW